MTFPSGAVATGSFTFDAANASFTNIDVVTTAGDGLAGETYTGLAPYPAYFAPGGVSDFAGRSILSLYPEYPLNDFGGAVPVQAAEYLCDDVPCSRPSLVRTTITGYVSSLPLGGAVPEPATWAMLIAGFGLVGTSLRRRAREVVA